MKKAIIIDTQNFEAKIIFVNSLIEILNYISYIYNM